MWVLLHLTSPSPAPAALSTPAARFPYSQPRCLLHARQGKLGSALGGFLFFPNKIWKALLGSVPAVHVVLEEAGLGSLVHDEVHRPGEFHDDCRLLEGRQETSQRPPCHFPG